MPLIPFAMIPVAALMAGGSRWANLATIAVTSLSLIGGVEMLLFQGAGGRIPPQVLEPLADAVWPLWTGQVPYPSWRFGEQFGENLVSLSVPERIKRMAPHWRFIQYLPLAMIQCLAIAGLWHSCLRRTPRADSEITSC